MLTLNALRSAPLALANWMGIRGGGAQPAARILLYHGTPRSEAAALERELRWLKRRFQVVPLHSLLGGPGRCADGRDRVALTFDDGLRSNVEVAYPLLHRLALPATFFVCPGLIDRGAWLWTHEARCRLARLAQTEAQAEAFVQWMKGLGAAARREAQARLREATPGFTPSPAERAKYDLAGWDELRRLDPAIVTVGSHTLTHPILPASDPEEIEAEVGESRRMLERELERRVDLFAYPNGDSNEATEACVRRHYRAAVTAADGWVRRGTDRLRLPRLCAPPGVLRLARRIYP